MIMKMEAEDKMILDNIDEFLNDEGRIVTYKFLSLTLSIHVNKAKLLLEEYLKSKNDDEYEVVYFLGGAKTVANKQALKFTLAKKENLEAIKRKFDAVNICHIYSAQKSNLKDIELLYSTDYDIIKKSLHDIHHYSEVQCKFTRRTNLQPPKVNNNISTNGNHTEKQQPLPASKQPAKEKKKSPDKGKETSTAAFFGTKTTGKKSNASNEIQKDTKKPEPKKEKPNNKLADAFSKSKVKPKQEEKKEDSKKLETEEEEKEKAEVAESCDKKNDKQTSKTSKLQCKDKYRDLPKAEKPKNRKAVMQGSDDEDDFENFLANTKKDKSDSASTKSNKRTAVFEEEEKEDDDDVLAPTPEPLKKPKNKRRKKEPEKSLTPPKLNTDTEAKEETKKAKKEEEPLQAKEEIKNVEKVEALQVDSPPSNTTTEERSEIISTQKRRGKRKVLKSKQYMSEDGFMITQKEYEEESFSENSDVEEMSCQTEISPERKRAVEAKKTVKALENRAKVHTQKIKTQSSLTSFFKRK